MSFVSLTALVMASFFFFHCFHFFFFSSEGIFSHNFVSLPLERPKSNPLRFLFWSSLLSSAWLRCVLIRVTGIMLLPVLWQPGFTVHADVSAVFTIIVSRCHIWRVVGPQWKWLLVRRETSGSARQLSSAPCLWAWNGELQVSLIPDRACTANFKWFHLFYLTLHQM